MKRIGDIAAKILADCAAAMERKASGASKAGVNLDIGCPRNPLAAEATEGDLPGGKAVSPRSPVVGPEVWGQANDDAAPKAMRVPSHRGPPGSEGNERRLMSGGLCPGRVLNAHQPPGPE